MAETPHKSAKATQPIADISRPGRSLPSDSSKPIMVSNRPIMHDPMVAGSAVASDKDSLSGAPLLDLEPKDHPSQLPPSQKKIQITPPSEESQAAAEPVAVKVKPADSAHLSAPVAADSIPEVVKEPVPAPKESPKPTPPKADAPKDTPAPVSGKKDESTAEDASADAPSLVDQKQLAADAAQAAKVAELVKREVYTLPINAVERRRSQHMIVGGLLLIILLALAWLDLAADAGFIHVPHLPLTHFFRV